MFYSVIETHKSNKVEFSSTTYFEKFSTACAQVDAILEDFDADNDGKSVVNTSNFDCKAFNPDSNMCAFVVASGNKNAKLTVTIMEHEWSDVFDDEDDDEDEDE